MASYSHKEEPPMHTIIKIAVVSVLSLFAIVGVVSISKAEENRTSVVEVTAEEKKSSVSDLLNVLEDLKSKTPKPIKKIGESISENAEIILRTPTASKIQSDTSFNCSSINDDEIFLFILENKKFVHALDINSDFVKNMNLGRVDFNPTSMSFQRDKFTINRKNLILTYHPNNKEFQCELVDAEALYEIAEQELNKLREGNKF
jgi:hypothetical protein